MELAAPLGRIAFALAAAPFVFLTGWRLARLDRRLGFEALLAEARARAAPPLPGLLARPEALAGAVERWLPLAPPRRYGPCLRRALLLMALWSRCGVTPTLHLGFHRERQQRDGHAWLTARGRDGRALQASGPLDFEPTFEL